MPKKYHLEPKPTAPRFISPSPFGLIEGDGCLNCANCVKKSCIYLVFRKRGYDDRQMMDTADSLCKNCFRCVQGCYARILAKTANPEFWSMGDDYWTPEIIASNQRQAEAGKIPVSGGGYGGPFAGPGFDSMWTDMSEIVRPTRDGIHGREYISTAVELGRIPKRALFFDSHGRPESRPGSLPPRVEISIPMIFDLLPFVGPGLTVRLALARAAQETQTLMVIRMEDLSEELLPLARHLVPLLSPESADRHMAALAPFRMVQLHHGEGVLEKMKAIQAVHPKLVVSIRLPLTPRAEEEVAALVQAGVGVIHLEADEKGKEKENPTPLFIKERIRSIHLGLVKERRRDEVNLIFGGGIALAEHVAKAIICGADGVAIERPLLISLECRLCRECTPGEACPVELDKIDPEWGRQRTVNLMAAWHAQLLEVLGAMGIRDIRRLRGEAGRAIFREEIEKETFGRIFGERVRQGDAALLAPGRKEGRSDVLAS
jgi:ferredoxin